MGYWQNKLIEEQEEAWEVRVGQIETVLTYFGGVCSVSVERADGVTVYVQARRVPDAVEVEAIGNTYLPEPARLTDAGIEVMKSLGWTAPELPETPNFTRTVAEGADLHALAVVVGRTFQEVYGVRGHETWVVSPPEFGQVEAGLEPFEILDPDTEVGEVVDVHQVLREGSGVELAAVVASAEVSFEDCLAAGLPRGERIAEMAMLYRADCPVEFLRKSAFHLNVLADPQLPLATARAVLAARPTAYEIAKLSNRRDIARDVLLRAAAWGHRLARARGVSGGDYLRLDCVPPQRLTEVADQQDGEAAGLLRNPRCPDDLVLRYLTAPSARVRYSALAVARRRDLAIDPVLLRTARDLPLTDQKNYPYADRIRAIAEHLLAARTPRSRP